VLRQLGRGLVLRRGTGGREPDVRPARGQHLGRHRAAPGHFLSEVIATLGLLLVIFALARSGRSRPAAAAVGAYR
jgi:glycerol uptake facilitator-like aquaporin